MKTVRTGVAVKIMMKDLMKWSLAVLAIAFAPGNSIAEDEKSHHPEAAAQEDRHHDAVAGPNGGRVITSVEPHLEFLVNEDRTVKITAVDDDGKPAELGETTVTVIGGERSNPTRLSFTDKAGVLVSDKALPEGDLIPLVVQIKTTPEAKVIYERFYLDVSECPGCDFKEYACVCDHGE